MKLGKLEKYSIGYFFTLHTLVKHWHNYFWYKRVTVTGKENLKKGVSYIITPNHQNALMDAMIFVANNPFQIVWLARADIFSSKIASSILRLFRIMPIFRIRDGAASLGKNEEIFNKSVEVLENNIPLALFPETTHWGYRRLRATKKAVPRIAFLAEEKNNYNLNVHIVPCGIYYEAYQPARSSVLLQYGKPFPIKEYIELYRENENKGYQALRKRIEAEIRPLIIDIKHDELYESYEALRNIYDDVIIEREKLSGKKMLRKFKADKILIDRLDDVLARDENIVNELAIKTQKYLALKSESNFRESTMKHKGGGVFDIMWGLMKKLVFLPLFIVGAILNFIPYYIPLLLTKKIVKDPQFVSSFNFALTVILFPLFHLTYTLLFNSYFDFSWYWSLVFFVAITLSAIFTIDYYNSARELIETMRYTIMSLQKNTKLERLKAIRSEIIETLDHLFRIEETRE